MPRTVIYDLKNAFGTLRKVNALYDLNDDISAAQSLWYVPNPSSPEPSSPPSTSFLVHTNPFPTTPNQHHQHR